LEHFSRRQFLRAGAVGAAGAAAVGGGAWWAFEAGRPPAPDDGLPPFAGYGPVVDDPDGVLHLPEGFRYTVLAAAGDRMDDGGRRPRLPDGAEVFDAGNGRLALCSNHEIREPGKRPNAALDRRGGRATSAGGCTTLIVNQDNTVESEFVSQSDTVMNCAGGKSPWGTWLTCEEIDVPPSGGDDRGYGMVYDVDPFTGDNGPPYPALGRFRHEALVFDPATGIVYLTEDHPQGLFYRFLPQRRDDLSAGRLEALAVPALAGTTDPLRVEWIDVSDVRGSGESLHGVGADRGATVFDGCEGITHFGRAIYFDEGEGGDAGLGRIWRYHPAGERLELWYESGDASALQQPDNLRDQPGTGDLYLCEDGAHAPNKLVVQSGRGEVFTFAEDATGSELAGACWDPTGRRLFVNLHQAGLTVAIEGPFREALAAERERAAAGTATAGGVRRADPDTAARAGRDRGMTPLEVEAALALGLRV
jgi:secreted PhoX family phosphatase